MGIPYSTQINAAFDQVTPLVAAALYVNLPFPSPRPILTSPLSSEVLQTTKNIALLLAFIQVATLVVLILMLFALLGLLFTVNPDLERERQELVTPVMHWLASWVFKYGRAANWVLKFLIVVAFAGCGVFFWQGSAAGTRVDMLEEEEGKTGEGEEGGPEEVT